MKKTRAMCLFLREEIRAQIELFQSLWPGWEDLENTTPPHRQRTAVNRLVGYAMFLGMPTGRHDPRAAAVRQLRDWQKKIGRLRDVDVAIETVRRAAREGGADATPAAEAFTAALRAERAERAAALLLDARGLDGARVRAAIPALAQRFDHHLALLEAGPDPFDHRAALARVRAPWLVALDVIRADQSNAPLHAFRVRNKRLRFVLDVLAGMEWDDPAAKDVYTTMAATATAAHNTLGALSDLHMLDARLRLQRARWEAEGAGLGESAAALEAGRARMEANQFNRWFAGWPGLLALAEAEAV